MALATCFFDFASFIVVNVTDKLFYSLLIDEVIEINQKNLRETDKELEKVLTANARHLVIQEGAEGKAGRGFQLRRVKRRAGRGASRNVVRYNFICASYTIVATLLV